MDADWDADEGWDGLTADTQPAQDCEGCASCETCPDCHEQAIDCNCDDAKD